MGTVHKPSDAGVDVAADMKGPAILVQCTKNNVDAEAALLTIRIIHALEICKKPSCLCHLSFPEPEGVATGVPAALSPFRHRVD